MDSSSLLFGCFAGRCEEGEMNRSQLVKIICRALRTSLFEHISVLRLLIHLPL